MTGLMLGCGYLGLRVARRLIDRGDRAIGTTRSAARAEALRQEGIEPAFLDVLEPPDRLPSADAVLFCVGFDRSTGVPVHQVYVEGLRRVLDRLGQVARLVYASSTGVYGDAGGGWVDESTNPDPQTESGRACLEAEGLIAEFAALRAVPATILRLAGLYGPGRIIRRAALERGEPVLGDPENWVNLIQIDDAASATLASFDRPGAAGEVRIVNVADSRPVTRRELYTLAASLIGAPEPRFVGESGAGVEPNKRASNRRMRDVLGFRLRYPDITTGLPASIAGEDRAR